MVGLLIAVYVLTFFYREMHSSAKRGLSIACRPSVCLCDVGGLWSHRLESWKLIPSFQLGTSCHFGFVSVDRVSVRAINRSTSGFPRRAGFLQQQQQQKTSALRKPDVISFTSVIQRRLIAIRVDSVPSRKLGPAHTRTRVAQPNTKHIRCLQPKGDPPTLRGNTGKFWGDYRWGRENGFLGNKSGNISETRKDGGKVTMGAYRNSPTLFRTVPSPTPLWPPLPRDWGFASK